ncbi:MAG: Gfo/Idh/MocA family oxidoreductase [Thermogemmata sp.]|uniref:Gfo/Idh/MocA family oxidoreductase n=1 Tax=Thermogemmata fonticola TaxID=2755323 RepID=A0A7V8VER0_9BACT|nr:Gfo/Idh/MocA family oxidoreductase [Thermogemmata fonticola]MBA2226678.1 Gfo/Idh/MocA family oxidoreductase [Thermogemmata fonticola]
MPDHTQSLLIAGVGPHARHFYLPAIATLGSRYGVRLAAAIELEAGRAAAASALSASGLNAEILTVQRFEAEMPEETRQALDAVANRLRPRALIIATDPLCHRPYVLWALQRGMDVLLDKPITTRRNAVSDVNAARDIERDFEEISAAWHTARRQRPIVVSVCAHRRYHPGFEEAIRIVQEVCQQTGCPVTNIYAYHADGQWRLPEEIRTQDHHSYHSGHGKASHSGHHFFDCVYRYYHAGTASGKSADSMTVYASFVQPRGLLRQLTRQDYKRLFGPDYANACPYSDAELDKLFQDFGEVDVNAVITFSKEGVAIGQASLSLLHNSFSRRGWLHPAADLYKGNGRVKHEHHRIHIGPFLTIAIHSYQAKSDHSFSDESDLQLGGNNHFEIHIFRNTRMIGGKEVEVIHLDHLAGFDRSRLYIEQVKEGVVGEFFRYIAGQLPEADLRSPLTDHAIPVRMISAVYESHVKAQQGDNPVIVKPLKR